MSVISRQFYLRKTTSWGASQRSAKNEGSALPARNVAVPYQLFDGANISASEHKL
jgi:hypothetical protein